MSAARRRPCTGHIPPGTGRRRDNAPLLLDPVVAGRRRRPVRHARGRSVTSAKRGAGQPTSPRHSRSAVLAWVEIGVVAHRHAPGCRIHRRPSGFLVGHVRVAKPLQELLDVIHGRRLPALDVTTTSGPGRAGQDVQARTSSRSARGADGGPRSAVVVVLIRRVGLLAVVNERVADLRVCAWEVPVDDGRDWLICGLSADLRTGCGPRAAILVVHLSPWGRDTPTGRRAKSPQVRAPARSSPEVGPGGSGALDYEPPPPVRRRARLRPRGDDGRSGVCARSRRWCSMRP